jgi:predicted nucleic acid-binding protein
VKYFLDTNLIIDFLAKKPQAISKLLTIAQQGDSEIFVNRLVYLETLRTIPVSNSRIFRDSKAVIDGFEFLDINQEIYDKSIDFSRYCQSKGAAIDFLHFITAKHYALELLSNDQDMEKLADAYTGWLNDELSLTL